MLSFKNKLITKIGVPLFKCPVLPFIHIFKLTNMAKKRISLSENGIGTKDDPVYLTAHRGAWADAPMNSLPAFKKSVERSRVRWS